MRQIAVVGVTLAAIVMAGSAAEADCSMLSAGVAYGSPGKLSGFVDSGCELGARSPYVFVLGGQVGIGGGEIAAGFGRRIHDVSSLNLRAVVARTWLYSEGVGGNHTLVGGRLEYSLVGSVLWVSGGVLVPVSGPSPRSARFSWNVGVGIPLWLLSWGIGPIEV